MTTENIYLILSVIFFILIIVLWLSFKRKNTICLDKIKKHIDSINIKENQLLTFKEESFKQEKEILSLSLKNQEQNNIISDIDLRLNNSEELIEKLRTENTNLLLQAQSLQTKQEDLIKQKENLQTEMQKHFENIAEKIFKQREKDWKEDSFGNFQKILHPLNEKIDDFQKNITNQRVEQSKISGEFKGELNKLMQLNKNIAEEAQQLSKALKGDNKLQGDWGEYRLETLLQSAGLHENIHYTKQNNFVDEEKNRKIPDFIIRLPDDKSIILDAKVSLVAYEKYFQASSETEKQIALKEHLTSIKNHIKALSSKNYHNLAELKTVDYTFLFVSIEPALFLAATNDTGLYDFALQNNIVLLSHSTLLATLRTISHIWKQEDQRKNAQKIAEQATGIYNQVSSFVEQVEKLGSQIETIKKTQITMVTKLTGKQGVVNKIEKMRKLGLSNTKSLNQKYIENAKISENENE